MASPSRSATSSDGLGADLSPTVIKGAILIFVALVLGVVLLTKGTDVDTASTSPGGDDATAPVGDDGGDESGDEGGDDNGGDTSATSAPDSTATTATTEPAEARPPEEVTVLVANASGLAGAAGLLGEQLSAEGYLIAEPDNAKTPADGTVIHYIDGFEAEARALAEVLGVDLDADPEAVSEVPTPVPTMDENMGAANLLVLLGTDLAPTS